MRRIYKIIGGILVAGTLVAGIGSGVAFAEYSTFEYGGESLLEGSERFTKTLKYKVPATGTVTEDKEEAEEKKDTVAEEKPVLCVGVPYLYTVVEDTSVPKDTVRFEVSYLTDDKNIEPQIIENGSEGNEWYIFVECNYQSNDFRDMIRAKDAVLSDLKNHKISDYQMNKVEMIEISVNPKADFNIEVNGYGYYD